MFAYEFFLNRIFPVILHALPNSLQTPLSHFLCFSVPLCLCVENSKNPQLLNLRRRRLALVTTVTELPAMAISARTGCRTPITARGMAIRL